MKRHCLFLTAIVICALTAQAQVKDIPSIKPFSDGIHHWNLFHAERNYARLAEDDYQGIADNLVAYQNADGGWMKNIDWLAKLPADSVKAALNDRARQSTLDNANTFPQIVYLAQAYYLSGKRSYRDAAQRGLEYLLRTQKKRGGWRGWDVDAITFNDDVTTGVLRLFQGINAGDIRFSWVDDNTRRRIYQSYEKGIRMILDAQYVQDGVKTAWCQQHDNKTLQPTGARTFELPSLVSRESCYVIDLLMSIPHPTDEVREAVETAVAWLEKVAIQGIRIDEVSIPAEQITNHEYPFDRVVKKDRKAPRIWSRFYEMDDNTPFMCNRDGVKVYQLKDVLPERRVGYDWYTYEPEEILQAFPQWQAKVERESRYAGYEVTGYMPTFTPELKQMLTWPMAWGNDPEKEFSAWRNKARAKLLECISPAPPAPTSYDMEVIDSEQREGYVAQKIVFNISGLSRVPAYLLIPNSPGPHPAMLMLHDHGAHFSIGKEKMVKPFHVTDITMMDAEDWNIRCYDGQYPGDFMAQHGYVVLAVDALFWGERGRKEYPLYDIQQALSANLLQMGMSFGGFIAWDDIRSAEFLASLPEVDPDRIGAMGFSMGAHRAWMTAAGTDKIAAAMAVCWMNTTDSLMTLTNNQNKGGSAYSMLVPSLRLFMDYPHVASIACPKPMLFTNGIKDKLFPVEGVKDAYAIMQQVYDSQGVSDRLETKLYDLPHFCSKEVQQHMLDFFNKWLDNEQASPESE